ncbi:aminopeptidase P family protein [Halobacteriales archaeon QS_1_68_20]|nr:MAG: aminopeptidase P family protein [Halobacteriales archaeon QS_1_68_20]
MDRELVAEKTEQAREAVAESDADAWLTFARETTEIAEPCLPYLLGFDVVWPTVVLVIPDRSAVVLGRHDAPNAERLDVHDVSPYDESMADPVADLLAATDPDRIAVNYSEDDVVADGLTHGMYRRLEGLLDDAGFDGELTSAESIVGAVRGRKSPTERGRVREAAERTEGLFAEMADEWNPDWTEADVSEFLHDRMREEGYGSAWSWDYCPTVHAGGDVEVGHTLPGDRTVPQGELLHVDFGVTHDGYAADVQRVYFRPEEPDGEAPDDLQAAFADVRAAIDAGRELLEPGVQGHEVDAAAREELTDRGWPAFQHAFGHQVGRNAHDGGTLLGPLWDRYGDQPRGEVRAGEIYTVELGVDTEFGYVGQEEMVRVIDGGHEFVVGPQTELRRLSP